MLLSMTGFGRGSFEMDGWAFGLELRSVNARFLEVKVSLPWPNADVDHELRARCRQRLARGRVELAVRVVDRQANASLALNTAVAQALARALRELSAALGEVDLATAAQLVSPPRDLLSAGEPANVPSERILEALLPAFEEALDELVRMRAAEGQALELDLRARIAELESLSGRMAGIAVETPEAQAQRLRERLDRLGAEVLPERLAQEVALLADRCDVNEELNRLRSHLDQLRAVCDHQGPGGRKIEFLVQELNREVNTIGAKSAHLEMGPLVVEAKCCLERIREQAQNSE